MSESHESVNLNRGGNWIFLTKTNRMPQRAKLHRMELWRSLLGPNLNGLRCLVYLLNQGNLSMDPGQDYHDLGELYADAPVARGMGDVIVHRAILDDITGIPKLLDWISDGDIVILEMSRLITVETELRIAVDRIQSFVESDLSGEVIRLGTSRLLLLPSTFAISETQNTAY